LEYPLAYEDVPADYNIEEGVMLKLDDEFNHPASPLSVQHSKQIFAYPLLSRELFII